MRARDVIRLHERLERGLPVRRIDHPLAPFEPHLLELEGVEDARERLEILAQRDAFGVHVDEQPAAPLIDLDRRQAGAVFGQRAFPVLRVEDVDVLALEIEGPAMETADEATLRSAGAVALAWRVDQPAAAMRADIVERLDLVRSAAHDNDRVVGDLIGDEVADLGNLLDAASDLPDLGPQPLLLILCIVGREEGLDRIGQRLAEIRLRHGAILRRDSDRLVHAILLFPTVAVASAAGPA